jgi:chromosome segregation ATPase
MFRAAIVLVVATAACAQNPSPDTQALRALVTEIRQLRQDMQATTIATQRVQIVLYRLQTQTSLMTSAASRLDDARTSLGRAQSDRKQIADRVPQLEESVKNMQDPKERKNLEDALVGTKMQLEHMTADEQRLQSREIDAETQFRSEQGKLADLQEQLDRLDKLLDSLSRKQ